MIRSSLKRSLRGVYIVIGLVLATSLAAKLFESIEPLPGFRLGALYDYLKDMSLLIVTVAAAYLTHIFQKRSSFLDALREEWQDIIATKSALIAYCDRASPGADDYLSAFLRLSETIDNMRIVYRNVGETDELIGLYPFSPLHDMRRALQSIEPSAARAPGLAERRLVREAVLQCFYAVREAFLDELDLEAPSTPILPAGGRRRKQTGSTESARRWQDRQRESLARMPGGRADIDQLLIRLRQQEAAGEQERAKARGA